MAFGPTYPGEDLRYPGVRFCFDDEGLRDTAREHDDRSQEVVRLLITQTQPPSGEIDALSEVRVSPMMYGELAEAIAKVSDNIFASGFDSSWNAPRYTMALSFVFTQRPLQQSTFV